jgi:ribosomal-protein-serine acetyltransferase
MASLRQRHGVAMPRELDAGPYRLRAPRSLDAPRLLGAVRDSLPELCRWMRWATPDYGPADALWWVQSAERRWDEGSGYEFLVMSRLARRVVGACGLELIDRLNQRANLGYWVRTTATGQGIATLAAAEVARIGFEVLGLKRIEIVVAVDNGPSLAVARKLGARPEGVQRNRLLLADGAHDAVMHSLVPGDSIGGLIER